jgi:hypothetical protein
MYLIFLSIVNVQHLGKFVDIGVHVDFYTISLSTEEMSGVSINQKEKTN